jgi:carbonic anhydrase
MAGVEESEIHQQIQDQFGVDTSELEFRTVSDQRQALAIDVERVRKYKLLNKDVVVGGAIYDVATGKITPVDC